MYGDRQLIAERTPNRPPLYDMIFPQSKHSSRRNAGLEFSSHRRNGCLPFLRLRHSTDIARFALLALLVIFLFFSSIDELVDHVYPRSWQSIFIRSNALTAGSSSLISKIITNRYGQPIKVCEAPLSEKATWFWKELLGDQGGAYHKEQFGFGGMGTPVNQDDRYIRKTNMYNLGNILYSGLKASPLWTKSCVKADIVFVNYDVGVERYWLWAKNEDDFEHRKNSLLPELLASGSRKTHLPLLGQKPHFMPLSKVEWDFKSCDSETAKGFLCDSRAYHDMMYWTVEKEAVGKSFPHITAAPYPAHIHLDPAFPLTRLQKTRDIAVFATWQNRPVNFDNPNVRSELARQCGARNLDCKFYENTDSSPYDPAKAAGYYRRSIFCIQPPSDMPGRPSIFDAAVNGCINVFLQRDIKLPFQRWIDWSEFTVTIDYERLKRENIVDILTRIPESEVLRMQNNLSKYRHGLQYSLAPNFDNVRFDRLQYFDSTDDALTLALKDAVLTNMELFPHLWEGLITAEGSTGWI